MHLNIKNLSKKFGKISVLKDINLKANKGEIISIVGPSGSGKTTLLRCLSGFCNIDNGKIILDSKEIQNLEANKRNISYVFQESPLFPHLSVIENILFNIQDVDHEKLNFLLEKIQITQLKNRYPYEISGGENQRISVARSLIRNPDLLLLDEPFNSLDNSIKEHTKELVFDIIKKTNTTTIIVNHDTRESLEISDKILVLDKDNINMINTPVNVYTKPKTLNIAKLFGEVNCLDIEGKKIYCRPNNISVVNQSKIKARVIESKFLGPFYKIITEFKSEKIILFHKEKIEKNTILNLSIDQKNKLHFQ
tara:strand:- start:1195 stop:2118 length:924 start_codon:yes stop_codon:yes gene_type:complete